MKKYLKQIRSLIITLLLIPLAIAQTNSVNTHIKKELLNNTTASLQQETGEDQLEEITVDYAFSVGGWCICAEYLQKNDLRKMASPLDWMRKYSLNTVIHLFETKFTDFFKNMKVTNQKNQECDNRTMYDTKNHIESIRYIPYNVEFDKAYNEFITTMKNRAQKMDQALSKSESVLLLNCRNNPETTDKDSTDKELKQFAKKFSKLYPNLKKIYLVDIHNDKSKEIHKKIIQKNEKIKIIQYRFKNVDKSFSPMWLGNEEAWSKIMKNIHLTQKSQELE